MAGKASDGDCNTPDNYHASRICMAKLHEHCQKNNLKMEYKDIDITGPPHNRIFTVAVVLDTTPYSPGSGKSKKEAKAQAAVLAWNTIERQKKAELDSRQHQHQHQGSLPVLPPPPPPPPPPAASFPECSSSDLIDYVSLLNEYALKNKVHVQYNLVAKTGMEHMPIFSFVCQIDGKIFDVGTGSKVQTAKLEAARLAYEKLSSSTFTAEESANSTSDTSDTLSIIFQELLSGACGNSTDLDSQLKGTSDTDAKHTDVIQVSPLCQPRKSKREEITLAARFSNPPERNFTINERFLNDFEEIKYIGSGSFGNVFKAKHKTDKKVYAVKRIKYVEHSKRNKKEGEREVQALATLEHPHIVRYFSCWTGEDIFQSYDDSSGKCNCLFIQMELCEKGNLNKWINQEMGMPSCKDDSIIIFQQIVKGVDYIHSKNFIHRDLKPLNIFFYSDNVIKIGDFGLVTSGVNDISMQRTRGRGTKLYMAPEQETSFYDKEVDIFPLGLILYEMLSPFSTCCEKQKEWYNIRQGKLPETFVEKFTEEAALIKQLLSVEPSQRLSAANILEFLKSQPFK